ncbi:hypothetical protein ACQCY4_23345, partial [Salmonella enterica]
LACEPGGCSAPVAGYSACLTSFTSSIRFSLHAYKNSVASSTAYKMASPGVQMAMMSVVEDIADPKELALHQKEVRRLGASYLSDSGVSWASKTVSPFTAWCNFNRLES